LPKKKHLNKCSPPFQNTVCPYGNSIIAFHGILSLHTVYGDQKQIHVSPNDFRRQSITIKQISQIWCNCGPKMINLKHPFTHSLQVLKGRVWTPDGHRFYPLRVTHLNIQTHMPFVFLSSANVIWFTLKASLSSKSFWNIQTKHWVPFFWFWTACDCIPLFLRWTRSCIYLQEAALQSCET